MNHELNNAIESLILNKPKSQSYSTRELNYIRRYDKCEDEGLDIEETIRQIWDTEQKESPVMVRMGYYGGSCLITHGQSGQSALLSPAGANLTIFNNDYFCHEITKALTSGRHNASTTFEFGTIAEYFFLSGKGVYPQYNTIISHPPRRCDMAELDFDENLADVAKEDARIYYGVRAYEFLASKGAMYLIVESKDAPMIHRRIVEHLADLYEENFDFEVLDEDKETSILTYRKG